MPIALALACAGRVGTQWKQGNPFAQSVAVFSVSRRIRPSQPHWLTNDLGDALKDRYMPLHQLARSVALTQAICRIGTLFAAVQAGPVLQRAYRDTPSPPASLQVGYALHFGPTGDDLKPRIDRARWSCQGEIPR